MKGIEGHLVVCLVLLFLTACVGTQPQMDALDFTQVDEDFECKNDGRVLSQSEKIERHVVRFNKKGFVVQPVSNELLSRPLFERKIDRMLVCAERLADSKSVNKLESMTAKKKVKLLIHVHGGLNVLSDTTDRAMALGPAIQNDGKNWHYPIFISWPSSALGTYGEHLWSIREGRIASFVHSVISLPFVLISDLFQVGSVITSMYMQAERVSNEMALNLTSLSRKGVPPGWLKVAGDGLPTAWKMARKNHEKLQASHSQQVPKTYWSGYYYPDSLAFTMDYLGRHALKTLSYPIRTTLGTAYNGAIVESAWHNMKRRTKNVFHPPLRAYDKIVDNLDGNDVSYRCKKKDRTITCVEGGRFFQYLLQRIQGQQERSEYAYEVTLVGHSMGTIVLNNALKRYRSDWIKSDVVRNIVYMAAADSIRNTMDSLFPILLNKAEDTAPIKFYNLMLNRLAEISEATVLSFLPNGSLLVNIDDHLEKPETPLDRTIGQEVNVLSVFPAIHQELSVAAEHTQFKSFDRYPGCGPDSHGDFNNMPFWRKSFWIVDTQLPLATQASNMDCPYNAYPKTCLDTLKKGMKSLQNEQEVAQYLALWCQ